MKDILYILSSDAENLSLVMHYGKLLEKGYLIDCYAPRKDHLSLYPFMKIGESFSYVSDLSAECLAEYKMIICGRNCFDIPEAELLLDYKGVIVADDTCFYEGHSVYGDFVCVCGEYNYRNVPEFLKNNTFITGCIKADYSNVSASEIWKKIGNQYKQKVLFIESGHFPFGREGREKLAREFCRMVLEHPTTFFVVKPRFLKDEVMCAKHRNADHLYKYIYAECLDGIPENMLLLDTHENMNELVYGADICMCTYCSAHIEVVYAKKKLMNICDVPSEETADFSANRFAQITKIIDLAECNVLVDELSESLEKASYASEKYQKAVNQGNGDAVESFVGFVESILEKGESVSLEKQMSENRFLGYALKKISYLENRWDDYSIGYKLLPQLQSIYNNTEGVKSRVSELEQFLKDYMYQYIEENLNLIRNNIFQKAFAIRYLSELITEEKAKTLAENILFETQEQDIAACYYWALYYWSLQNYVAAKEKLSLYLEMTKDSPYAKTELEELWILERMQKLYVKLEELV